MMVTHFNERLIMVRLSEKERATLELFAELSNEFPEQALENALLLCLRSMRREALRILNTCKTEDL